MVVPNVMAYATHSAVGVYDSERHFLDLDELSPGLIGDALIAMVRHARAVRRFDPEAVWSSINANYLPPSGASLVHPHLQSAHDAQGLTNQRLLVERSGRGRPATSPTGLLYGAPSTPDTAAERPSVAILCHRQPAGGFEEQHCRDGGCATRYAVGQHRACPQLILPHLPAPS